MKLKININGDDNNYYLADDYTVKKEIIDNEISSDRVKFMLDNDMIVLSAWKRQIDMVLTEDRQFDDIVAIVKDIDLENGYITIDDKSIREKYVGLLKDIKEADIYRVTIDMQGYAEANFFRRVNSFTLIGFFMAKRGS